MCFLSLCFAWFALFRHLSGFLPVDLNNLLDKPVEYQGSPARVPVTHQSFSAPPLSSLLVDGLLSRVSSHVLRVLNLYRPHYSSAQSAHIYTLFPQSNPITRSLVLHTSPILMISIPQPCGRSLSCFKGSSIQINGQGSPGYVSSSLFVTFSY